MGWPPEWVYRSTFGEEWKKKIKERIELSPLDSMSDDDLEKMRQELAEAIGRKPTEEEFILYLMHPKDAIAMIEFREKYGDAPLVLPTDVWRQGLQKPGDKVDFELWGKPYSIELVSVGAEHEGVVHVVMRHGDKVDFELWGKPYSIELVSVGAEHEGVIHVVMRVNNKTRVYTVETPRAKKAEIRMAKGAHEVGAPINGNIWRIGNPQRGTLKVGDIIHKGEEIANLEAMKMENAIIAPFDGQINEVCVKLNSFVVEGQLLFVLEKAKL